MVTYLPTDFTKLPAYDPTEYLTDEEVEAILEREQREAEAKFGSGAKAFDEHLHPRDAEGQFTETGDTRLMVSAGPMAGVKMTIGTLDEEDQATVRNTLNDLGERYPAVVPMITSVKATTLKGAWGKWDFAGRMAFTNIGAKYGEKWKDPELASTVAHEFAHAMFLNMTGVEKANDPPITRHSDRPPGYAEEYNARTSQQQRDVADLVQNISAEIGRAFGNDAEAIHKQLATEFASTGDYVGNPQYVADNPEELLAQAFGKYATGQHGKIADIVGHAIDRHYGVQHE